MSQPGLVLAPEDRRRAVDRLSIHASRAERRRGLLLWLLLGPGLLVMLGENGGPSMLSYAATGARYGIGFFVPFILLTFLMAFAVQEMTVRLAVATHRGHAELIFQRFGPVWGWFAMVDLVIGNLLTLVTEFIAIRAGGVYFGLPGWFSVGAGLLIVVAGFGLRGYAAWERAAMLLAAFNLLFVPVALLAHPDPAALGRALLTWSPLPGGVTTEFLTLLLANIGATVTPWMLFFQQSAVVDKGLTRADLAHGRIDTGLGAAIAATAAIAAVVAASALFGAVHGTPGDSTDFASALAPHIGRVGAALFALGLVEAGLIAAMTISTASSYALAEGLSARHSLNLDFRSGRVFYGVAIASSVLAAAVVLIPGAPLLALTLTVNVIATLLMAPALLFLFLLVNDRALMGTLANGPLANIVGSGIVAGLSLVGALYGVLVVFPQWLGP